MEGFLDTKLDPKAKENKPMLVLALASASVGAQQPYKLMNTFMTSISVECKLWVEFMDCLDFIMAFKWSLQGPVSILQKPLELMD